MLKMRSEPNKWGLTARFSRFSELFVAVWTLLAGKQPEIRFRTMGSTLRRTTGRLSRYEIFTMPSALNPLLLCAEGEP